MSNLDISPRHRLAEHSVTCIQEVVMINKTSGLDEAAVQSGFQTAAFQSD